MDTLKHRSCSMIEHKNINTGATGVHCDISIDHSQSVVFFAISTALH